MPKLCFGTVFSMEGVSREEVRSYVDHVNKSSFTKYKFPQSWWEIKPHPDASKGIRMLQTSGFTCVTLSNGDAELLEHVSESGGIQWDRIIDLASHRVYKPHTGAYRTVQKETGFAPEETLMVTANPAFGDIEGSRSIGMNSIAIRQSEGPLDICELAAHLIEEQKNQQREG